MAEKYHANRGENNQQQAQNAVKGIAKEAGNKYLEAHGVPKPIAEMATSKMANNPLVNKASEQLAKDPRIQQLAKAAQPVMKAMGKGSDQSNTAKDGNFEGEQQSDLDEIEPAADSSGTFQGKVILKASVPFLMMMLPIFLLVVLIVAAIFPAYEMMGGMVNSHENLYNRDLAATYHLENTYTEGKYSKKEEEKFYQKLEKVRSSFQEKYGVNIDTDLIAATLFSQYLFGDYVESSNNTDDDGSFSSEGGSNEPEDVSLKSATKQIELLARYQMKIIHYKKFMGCSSSFKAEIMEDSLTDELVSQNDWTIGNWQPFVWQEKNYENYRYWNQWRPCQTGENPTLGEANEGQDGSGLCCDSDAPADEYQLSTKENQVYYYNLLMERFIPEYYKSFMPEGEDAKKEKIKEIIDDIYLLYHTYIGQGISGNDSSMIYPDVGDGTMDQNTKGFFCNIQRPVESTQISSLYGVRALAGLLFHDGIDFPVGSGTNVHAVAGGTVYRVGTGCPIGGEKDFSCNNGAGNFVVIEHEYNGEKYYSTYMHLSSADASVGQKVAKGTLIGKSGNSGNTTGEHLHLQFNKHNPNGGKSISINPNEFFTNSNYYNQYCVGGEQVNEKD